MSDDLLGLKQDIKEVDTKLDKFITNDFAHATEEIYKNSKTINFIKGQLWVAIPLLFVIIGSIVGVISLLVSG